jgi:hypothetical protein
VAARIRHVPGAHLGQSYSCAPSRSNDDDNNYIRTLTWTVSVSDSLSASLAGVKTSK